MKTKERRISDSRFGTLTLLKASSGNKYPVRPSEAKLESFNNIYSSRDYEISFDCMEFTSLCPLTNQPDFGEIHIRYIPDKLCIESKSMKFFLFSFRNFNTFHEEAVNMILDKSVAACSPKWMEITGRFKPRGGISINVKASHHKKGFRKNE